MLAVLPAMTALGGVVLRLERAKVTTESAVLNPYLTSSHAWYLKDGNPGSFYRTSFSNGLVSCDPLTEKSLEELCEQMRLHMGDRAAKFVIRPTRRIVSPAEYHAIMQARERERYRSWWERLWTRILPA